MLTQRKQIYQSLAYQSLVMAIFAALISAFIGAKPGVSIACAALSVILPNAYFAYKLFGHVGATAVRRIVLNFYWGGALKVVLTFGLAIVFIKMFNLDMAWFLGSFVISQLLNAFAPLGELL